MQSVKLTRKILKVDMRPLTTQILPWLQIKSDNRAIREHPLVSTLRRPDVTRLSPAEFFQVFDDRNRLKT